ncbi:MAG: glutathione S-transferase N-terminal domain-containing protein [Polyangiaceae bacterium]|jgi:glutathione S-transferase
MLLFMSPTSPYARKVRIVLAEKKAAAEEIDHGLSERKPRAYNPLGKVPTLVLDDGTVLFDSVVITEALEALYPTPRLIPEATRDRIAVRRWEALGDGLCDVLIPIVIEERRPAEKRDAAHLEKHAIKVRDTIALLDRDIGERPYAHGDDFTLADAAVVSAVGYVALRRPDFLVAAPRLRGYANRLHTRPSVAKTTMTAAV